MNGIETRDVEGGGGAIVPHNTTIDPYSSVDTTYQLVEWRNLPRDVRRRLYEESVHHHQPSALIASDTRTRSLAVQAIAAMTRRSPP